MYISDIRLISSITKELEKLDTNNLSNQTEKMGYTDKQRIRGRGNSNDLEAINEMFNIPSHQGNANQSDSEVLFYTYQNG